MASEDRHEKPIDGIDWAVGGTFDTNFRWEYHDGRDSLLKLYEKGKERQWNANTRIDWSQDLDPENPEQLPDESIPLFGSDVFTALTPSEKATLRRHFQSWQLSQFLHGEQGALICTAKIVQQVPRIDAKFYAATQVIDEARQSRRTRACCTTNSSSPTRSRPRCSACSTTCSATRAGT
jgi:hypothetical protein